VRAAIPFDLLDALRNATPEVYAAVRRTLGLPLEGEQLTTQTKSAKTATEMVSEIHQEIKLIREERRALKSAKERLEQMQSEKLFAFTSKIDAKSFRTLCAVLAHGDIAKASRSLNVPENTLRSRIKEWSERGPAYQTLVDLVRWRKAIGRRGTVELNESITHATAAQTDFAGLLSDVLDELLAMDDDNWNDKVEALADLLRPHVQR